VTGNIDAREAIRRWHGWRRLRVIRDVKPWERACGGARFYPRPSRTPLCIGQWLALLAWMTPSSGHPWREADGRGLAVGRGFTPDRAGHLFAFGNGLLWWHGWRRLRVIRGVKPWERACGGARLYSRPSRTPLCIRQWLALVAWMTPSSGHPWREAVGEGLRWGEVLLQTESDTSLRSAIACSGGMDDAVFGSSVTWSRGRGLAVGRGSTLSSTYSG